MFKLKFSGSYYDWKTKDKVFVEDYEIMSPVIPNVDDLVSWPEIGGRRAKVVNIHHMFNPLAPEGERHIVYIDVGFVV